MLSAIDISEGVRLLGVGTTGLATGGARQLTFDELAGASGGRAGDGPAGRGSAAHGGGSDRSWREASGAIDEIRERFGDTAIGPASAVGRHGLRVKRRGDDPWGPST
jgi:hypothetical protein